MNNGSRWASFSPVAIDGAKPLPQWREATGSDLSTETVTSVLIDQLRKRLVRYSVRHHEEMRAKQEVIDKSNSLISALQMELRECALALAAAGQLVQTLTTDGEIPFHIRTKVYC